jgi:hypothetical protein
MIYLSTKFELHYDKIWYIYLTEIGLTPDGSSTVHIYTKQCTEQYNICRAAKLIWVDQVQFVALLYSFKLCYYYTKMAANTCYDGSYVLAHIAVSFTYKIWSCGLTRNPPFWVPTVDFNNN